MTEAQICATLSEVPRESEFFTLASSGISIRQAQAAETEIVSSVLQDAAEWLTRRGQPLWRMEEVSRESITPDVIQGMYWLAMNDREPAGCVRFQLEDPTHWPDAPGNDAAYIHKLAVKRRFSGGVVSRELIEWAKRHTLQIGRKILRLDCDAGRSKLAELYLRNGFAKHSEFQAGLYRVARFECNALHQADKDLR